MDLYTPLNYTEIVLVPKKYHANQVIDNKLISLTNVIYHLIAKSQVNRLKEEREITFVIPNMLSLKVEELRIT